MIKLPARQDGNWTVQYSNEKMPDIVATRNLTFDKEGYIALSKPTASWYSSADDADFGLPLFYSPVNNGGNYRVWTDTTAFHFTTLFDSINGAGATGTGYSGRLNVAQDTRANVPTSTSPTHSDGGMFYGNLLVSDHDSLVSTGNTSWAIDWTDRVTDLGAQAHPLCYDMAGNSIIVGDGNTVKSYNTAYALERTLTIPSDLYVKCLAYNNGYIAVGCHDSENSGNGAVYIWDNKSTSANYSYPVNSSTVHTVVPYKGSFLMFTTASEILYWTPQGLVQVSALPAYYDETAVQSLGIPGTARRSSSWISSGIVYFNLGSVMGSALGTKGRSYLKEQPAGIYCYDETVGLYHRHATTATKTIVDVIATASVDIADNEITVTSAPETGTPTRYYAGDSQTAIAGLKDDALYYCIKVDATTIKLAQTYSDALAGTTINLTGTGNNNQVLQFYPKNDFGQSYTPFSQQGCVQIDERPTTIDGGVYMTGLLYGAQIYGKETATGLKVGGYVLTDTENRGYLITTKLMSQQLQDDWQKIYIKHSKLVNDLDKIVVKYRTAVEDEIVKLKYLDANRTLSGAITWTDSDTFTTTDTQFADVLAGDEVEVVQGAGSGYLLHVSSITVNAGTYTVNLDEAVKNISANDTGRVVVSRWTKLTTLNATTPQNNDGYSELPLAVRSKSIQFKIELRGEDVEIEEILIAQKTIKFAV